MRNEEIQNPEFEPIKKALQRMPLEPAPFSELWLHQEPSTIVSVIPASSGRKSAYLLVAATVLLVAAIFFFLREDPAGKDSPAIVLFRQGDVTYRRDGTNHPLSSGIKLQRGDEIAVAVGSRLDLLLPDGSTMRIAGEAELRINSLNRKISLEQKKGMSYHAVASSQGREEYSVHTPTAIAGVRGTQFVVDSSFSETRIRVIEGMVLTWKNAAPEDEAVAVSPQEEVQIDSNIKTIEKKHASTVNDLVVFAELEEQRALWKPEVLEQLSAIEATADEGQIEKIYQRPLEVLYMTDGRVLKGVVAAQVDRTLILHTTEGVLVVPIEDLQEIRFQKQ